MVIVMLGWAGGEFVQLLDPEPVTDHLVIGEKSAERLPPSSRAISPKLKPGPIEATRAVALSRHPDLEH